MSHRQRSKLDCAHTRIHNEHMNDRASCCNQTLTNCAHTPNQPNFSANHGEFVGCENVNLEFAEPNDSDADLDAPTIPMSQPWFLGQEEC